MRAIDDGIIGPDHIQGDLSDVLSRVVRGRRTESEVTLIKSVGFSLQDVYASSLVYDRVKGQQSSELNPL